MRLKGNKKNYYWLEKSESEGVMEMVGTRERNKKRSEEREQRKRRWGIRMKEKIRCCKERGMSEKDWGHEEDRGKEKG